jgi:uracil permease
LAQLLVPILVLTRYCLIIDERNGTLIYTWVTKGGIPTWDRVFIAPASLIISSGFGHAQSGFIFFGLFL